MRGRSASAPFASRRISSGSAPKKIPLESSASAVGFSAATTTAFRRKIFCARKKYSSRTGSRALYFSPVEFFRCLVVPCSMFCETESEFQIAARTRAASGVAFRRAPQPRPRISLVTPTSLPQKRRASEASLITPAPRILIVTPRLEFPATLTKQSLGRISNRYKTAVFSSGFPAPARNRRDPVPPEFLIANLELEFFLNIAKSTKYKFLIANKCDFCVRRGGSRFCAPESLFTGWNLSSETGSTILAGRLKTIIGAIRRTLVKVKSLLCYGDSHFQLCKMITNSPSVRLGEN